VFREQDIHLVVHTLRARLLDYPATLTSLIGHSKTIIYAMSWMETVHENSLPLVHDLWKKLTVDQVPWSGEVVRRISPA
jgi:hypothetical protein